MRLPTSDALATAADYFSELQTAGSPTPEQQAVLYLLTREVRPSVTVEIGTLFAGTTNVLARALVENSHGQIITIDPFGAARVPQILHAMPNEVRDRIVFHPITSMEFFVHKSPPSLDLTFIDGDHSYPGALYDLLQTANRTAPGRVIVLDNSELSGVATAVAEFLDQVPGWRLIGSDRSSLRDVGQKAKGPGPFGMLILVAPIHREIGTFPTEWDMRLQTGGPFDSLILDLAETSAPGRLQFCLTWVAREHQFHINGRVTARAIRDGEIGVPSGQTKIRIPFEAVTLAADARSNNFYAHLEVRYAASDGLSPLKLAAEPRLSGRCENSGKGLNSLP